MIRFGLSLSMFLVLVWPRPVHPLEVGLASCDITPDVQRFKVPMAGYGAREGKPSTGVHDPLHAKVLYFRDGGAEMALITTDLRSVTPDLKHKILEKSAAEGLNKENVMVAASHNHSGPSLYPEKFWQLQFGEYDPQIVAIMSETIGKALDEAVADAKPARIGFAEKDLPEFTRNRRWEYDTEAREKAGETPALSSRLFVLRIDDENGKVRGVLVNYATHPTIMGASNMELSAEWPGVLQRELQKRFNDAIVAFANGAEGDQAPLAPEFGARQPEGTNYRFFRMEGFGMLLADAAAALLRTVATKDGLTISSAYVEAILGEPVFSEASKKGRYAFMQPMALEALPRNAVLQQFRIGNLVLAALPGEPIAEVGQATEAAVRAAGAKHAVTISLANDYIGYILNAKEYAHGGYEVDSRSFYGPGLGDLLTQESGKSAQKLSLAQANTNPETRRVSEGPALFNGKDFTGWTRFLPRGDVDDTWKILEDGTLSCTGTPAGYIRTADEYENYRITLDWRWTGKPGNNGLLLHCQRPDQVWPKSFEAQMYHENAGDIWVIGGADFKEHVNKDDRQVKKFAPISEKPVGEWNHYEAICEGDTITLYVNGVLQNKATECTLTKGYIALQSEGAPIEYRNVILERIESSGNKTAR